MGQHRRLSEGKRMRAAIVITVVQVLAGREKKRLTRIVVSTFKNLSLACLYQTHRASITSYWGDSVLQSQPTRLFDSSLHTIMMVTIVVHRGWTPIQLSSAPASSSSACRRRPCIPDLPFSARAFQAASSRPAHLSSVDLLMNIAPIDAYTERERERKLVHAPGEQALSNLW